MKTIKYLLMLAVVTLCFSDLSAQKEETIFNKLNLNLTGAWGGSMSSLTKFNDDNAVFTGGFGGLEFGKTLFVGWGGGSLVNDITIGNSTNPNFNMSYNGPMIGYAFRADKVIHPTAMLMFGRGQVELDDVNVTDKIFTVQPTVGIEVNVFRWFHVGLEGGYRFVTDTDIPTLTDADLSSAFGRVTFKFGWSWGSSKREQP